MAEDNLAGRTVSFVHMEDGTKEDYELLHALEGDFRDETLNRVLRHLELLDGSFGGYKISRLGHSLQSATLAMNDGASEEVVVAALLHDIGDTLSPDNHAELGASILKPFVREETYWVIKHHGIFQEYYYMHHFGRDRNNREMYKDSKHYSACVDFCQRYDQNAFDPDYDTEPLGTFMPMLQRIFSRAPFEHFDK